MTQTEFAKQIIEKIKTGNLEMLPKKKFVLKMVLGMLGAMVLVLCAVFFLSLIIYVARKTGAWHLPALGFRGLAVFLFGGFPWLLVLCLLVFMGLLEYYFRQFSFVYRRTVLSISLVLLAGTIFGAIFVEMFGLHHRLEIMPKFSGMPRFGPMYDKFGEGFKKNSLLGTVQEVRESSFVVLDADDRSGIVVVEFTDDTKFPQGKDFTIGDRIFAGGERQGQIFKALGIKKDFGIPKKMMQRGEGFPPPNGGRLELFVPEMK